MASGSAEPLVLGLDTAMVVTVGLARGGVPIGAAVIPDRMTQVEQLTPVIAEVCRKAGVQVGQLDQIVVGLGPGPFTGLRVGIVTARILAEVVGADLHGVCSLDGIAAHFGSSPVSDNPDGPGEPAGGFVVATDARRREVYWALYGADGVRSAGPYVSVPAEVPRQPTIGPAADLYPELLHAVPGPRSLDPSVLAVRGPSLPSAGQQPLYLRRPDAAEPGRRKSVLRRADRGPRPRTGTRR